jgi:hypothetical protein
MAHKRVAIVQSSYIPWKGYFDLIRAVDEFILLDTVQFSKGSWRNRNRIKTKDGLAWLSIPVYTSGRLLQAIEDTAVSDSTWATRHWQHLRDAYARTPFFDRYAASFEAAYRSIRTDRLSHINRTLTELLCEALGITTRISSASDYRASDDRMQRLIDLCRQAGATEYLSGPAARDYIDERLFAEAGIDLQFADYSGYPEYEQPYPPFEHAVSVVDLLFCTGPRAIDFMKDLCPAKSPA